MERVTFWRSEINPKSPYAIDKMNNNCQNTYHSFPDGLALIDEEGRLEVCCDRTVRDSFPGTALLFIPTLLFTPTFVVLYMRVHV